MAARFGGTELRTSTVLLSCMPSAGWYISVSELWSRLLVSSVLRGARHSDNRCHRSGSVSRGYGYAHMEGVKLSMSVFDVVNVQYKASFIRIPASEVLYLHPSHPEDTGYRHR